MRINPKRRASKNLITRGVKPWHTAQHIQNPHKGNGTSPLEELLHDSTTGKKQ